jgi:hypothetical protein
VGTTVVVVANVIPVLSSLNGVLYDTSGVVSTIVASEVETTVVPAFPTTDCRRSGGLDATMWCLTNRRGASKIPKNVEMNNTSPIT